MHSCKLSTLIVNEISLQEKMFSFLIEIASGDVTIEEFTVMMNQYVPTSTLGLRDLFNTFGKD